MDQGCVFLCSLYVYMLLFFTQPILMLLLPVDWLQNLENCFHVTKFRFDPLLSYKNTPSIMLLGYKNKDYFIVRLLLNQSEKVHRVKLRRFEWIYHNGFLRKKRQTDSWFIVPGTKWCGKEWTATKYSEIGGYSKTGIQKTSEFHFNLYLILAANSTQNNHWRDPLNFLNSVSQAFLPMEP